MLHTFDGQLVFNSHVHPMVTGGGLHGSSDIWVPRLYYDCDRLMRTWREAVIALLPAVVAETSVCHSELNREGIDEEGVGPV